MNSSLHPNRGWKPLTLVKARLQAKREVTPVSEAVPSRTVVPDKAVASCLSMVGLTVEELFLKGSALAAVNSLQGKSSCEQPSLQSCLPLFGAYQSAPWSQKGWHVTALPGVMSLHSTGGPCGGGTRVWCQGWTLIESCGNIPGI